MEKSSIVHVTIVNRYYPPNKSAIAEAANDLAIFLIDQGCHVKIVHTDGDYPGGGESGKIIKGEQHIIPAFYNGQKTILRLLGNLVEGFKLIRKARKVNEGVVIVMTNPMLLNIWAGMFFNRKKIPWIYWTMDLFPEGFASGNLVSKRNPIYKIVYKKTYSKKPDAIIALGRIQSQYLNQAYKTESIPTAILPCGVFLNNLQENKSLSKRPDWKKDSNKIYLGYVGNLGQAHSPDFIKWIIDSIDTEAHHLMLVVYGAKAQVIKDYIGGGKEGVTLMDYIPREDLTHIDIHLVSLIPEWVNVCVPSKMVSAVHQGALVLYYGSEHSDSYQDHKKASWLIQEGPNAQKEVEAFIKKLSLDVIKNKQLEAEMLPAHMTDNTQSAYQEILQLIKELN